MNRGAQGFIGMLVLMGVLLSVSLGFVIWSEGGLAQEQEKPAEPGYLVLPMLAGTARLWAQTAIDANVLGAAGLVGVGITRLSDAIYKVLHPTITDVSVLWNKLSNPDEYEKLARETIEQAIKALGGDVTKATAELDQTAKSLKDQIPSIRISNIDMIDNTSVRGIVNSVITNNPGASADQLLDLTIQRVRSDILGCDWDETDIATKVIGAITGIPISEVGEKSEEDIIKAAKEAIPGISQEALDLLGEAHQRLQESPRSLAATMLKTIADRLAHTPEAARVLTAAGVMADLSQAIYDRAHGKIPDVQTLWNYLSSQQGEFVDDIVIQAVKAKIKAAGGDLVKAQRAIETYRDSIITDIPTYRVTSIDTPEITAEIQNVADNVIKASTTGDNAYWNDRVAILVNKVREEVLGAPNWDEKEIIAKVLSIRTGLSMRDVLDYPDDPRMETAIQAQAEKFQPLLYAALRRLKSDWLTELEGRVADLNTKTAALSQQVSDLQQRLGELDALQQDVAELKSRRDELTLGLALIALLLGLGALALSLRRPAKEGGKE